MKQKLSVISKHHSISRYAAYALGALLCGGLALKLFDFQSAEAKSAATNSASHRAIELLASDVAQARVEVLQQTLPLTGTLQPLNQTEIKSEQAGKIIEVLVREGDAVRRGQVLARLDSSDLSARLQDKMGALEVGEAQRELAHSNVSKNEQLLKEGFISQAAFDSMVNSHQVSEATIVSLRAQVQQARKAFTEAVIRSPLDGVIAERIAQPGLGVANNTQLFTVQNLAKMNVDAPVPASDIPLVKIGQVASLSIEGFGERRFVGKVDRINPSTEKNSRSIIVHLHIDNTDKQLKGGMFAQGSLGVTRPVQAIVVPKSAVRTSSGRAVVFRILGGKLVEQAVEIGMNGADTDLAEITSGLEAGNEVVVGSMAKLESGQTVSIASVAVSTSQ